MRSFTSALLLLVGSLQDVGASSCVDALHKASTCASNSYEQHQAANSDECCARCASDDKCLQWTYGGVTKTCKLTASSDPVQRNPFTLASTCGVKTGPSPGPSPPPSPPSPPSPPAPGVANTWAVIAAGSRGFMNYRHQADACHAYQVLRRSGVPENQIILMMQDDVANSQENPFKGKLFNKPGTDVPDVYEGCNIDYRGSIVTAKLFLSVITGDETGVPNGGKVLKSNANDRVFLNFVDHGGVGIVAFPNGAPLHVSDLSSGLQKMQQKHMFKELVFYMEACESGSMFPHLTADGKIFAVTAANAKESSWGFYCPPNSATVNGKKMGTCLGDLFSIAWMEDADMGKFTTETIEEQVQRVTKRTNKSHVMTFGDKSFEQEPIGNFESKSKFSLSPASSELEQAMDVRDIPLQLAYYRWETADTENEKKAAFADLQTIITNRASDERLFFRIAKKACQNAGYGCIQGLQKAKYEIQENLCHRTLVNVIHDACPRRSELSSGGWNDFNMQFSQLLANMCERRQHLGKDVKDLVTVLKTECARSSEEAAGTRTDAELIV